MSMAVSQRLRYEVFRRDDFACRYCGAKAPDVEITVDHVVPIALGGADVASNLVTACTQCNAGKSSSAPDSPIVEGVSDDAIRWAAAMQRAAEIQTSERDRVDRIADAFGDAWGTHYSLPRDWRSSIEQWVGVGVDLDFLLDCLDIAFEARGVDWRWKYFCGIVWRRIDERQQIARELIDREQRGES
jgi:HNH endonuclease